MVFLRVLCVLWGESSLRVLVLAFALGLWLWPDPAPAEAKTLTRIEDPVVIAGARFAGIGAIAPGELALLARRDGRWEPIPFQIDEKIPDGSYALRVGPRHSRDPDRSFDGNDELCFMARDAGDHLATESWPDRAASGFEVEVIDSRDGGRAWVYLFAFAGARPLSRRDYVRFVSGPERWLVATTEYFMSGHADDLYPHILGRNLSGRPEIPAPGPDVLDRIKVRGMVQGPLGIRIALPFDRIQRARAVAWTDGPVRTLVAIESRFEFAMFRLQSGGVEVTTYYCNHAVWPTRLEVPDVGFIVKRVDLAGYMDFNSNAYGSHVWSEANPYDPEVALDGRMSRAETEWERKKPVRWIAGAGPHGAVLSRSILPESWSAVSTLPYFFDDENYLDDPEDDPGVSAAGFAYKGFEKLGPFSGAYQLQLYFRKQLAPEGCRELLDILDLPLQVSVNRLTLTHPN